MGKEWLRTSINFAIDDITCTAWEIGYYLDNPNPDSLVSWVARILQAQSWLSLEAWDATSRNKLLEWMRNSWFPTYSECADKIAELFAVNDNEFDRRVQAENIFNSITRGNAYMGSRSSVSYEQVCSAINKILELQMQ